MKHPWYIQIWEEGHNFDLWHVQHFIVGLLLAGLVIWFKLSFWVGFTIALVIIFGWEIFETLVQIEETRFNMIFDIVFSLIAYFLILYLPDHYLYSQTFPIFLESLVVIYVVLGVWGYLAYRIRTRSHKEDRVGKKILHAVKTELER
jgi:hypothetical protein